MAETFTISIPELAIEDYQGEPPLVLSEHFGTAEEGEFKADLSRSLSGLTYYVDVEGGGRYSFNLWPVLNQILGAIESREKKSS